MHFSARPTDTFQLVISQVSSFKPFQDLDTENVTRCKMQPHLISPLSASQSSLNLLTTHALITQRYQCKYESNYDLFINCGFT